jgi:hypothetical protein
MKNILKMKKQMNFTRNKEYGSRGEKEWRKMKRDRIGGGGEGNEDVDKEKKGAKKNKKNEEVKKRDRIRIGRERRNRLRKRRDNNLICYHVKLNKVTDYKNRLPLHDFI